MELSEAQKQAVKQWVDEGAGLSELQRRLSDEFGVSMTYMDIRFLVIDLGLQVKDKPAGPSSGAGLGAPGSDQSASSTEPGAVAVELDRVTKPGSLVSGSVRFSNGVSAAWALDQFGRVALDAGETGYSPSEQDLQVFQQKLKKELEKRGF